MTVTDAMCSVCGEDTDYKLQFISDSLDNRGGKVRRPYMLLLMRCNCGVETKKIFGASKISESSIITDYNYSLIYTYVFVNKCSIQKLSRLINTEEIVIEYHLPYLLNDIEEDELITDYYKDLWICLVNECKYTPFSTLKYENYPAYVWLHKFHPDWLLQFNYSNSSNQDFDSYFWKQRDKKHKELIRKIIFRDRLYQKQGKWILFDIIQRDYTDNLTIEELELIPNTIKYIEKLKKCYQKKMLLPWQSHVPT